MICYTHIVICTNVTSQWSYVSYVKLDCDITVCVQYRHRKFDFHVFWADYFRTENIYQLYSCCIYPVGHPKDWSVPVAVRNRIMLPSITWVLWGAPRTKRIPSASERCRGPRQEQVCSTCKQPGHNWITRKNSIGVPSELSDAPCKLRVLRHYNTYREPGYTTKIFPTPSTLVLEDEDQCSKDWI